METKTLQIEGMETKLKELAANIEKLETKVRKRHAEVETHMEQVGTLLAKHKTAHQRLEELEKATHEEWENLKSGWEEIIKDMQEVLDKLASSY